MIKGATDILKKVWYVLDKNQRKQVVFLAFAIIINTMLETVAVSIIFPLISVITDPKVLEENRIYSLIMQVFHIDSPKVFILLACTIMIFIYIIKNIYILWMNSYLYRFIYHNQRIDKYHMRIF